MNADEVLKLRELHATGAGRNECARQLGVSARVLSRVAVKLDPPLVWDRTQTAAATSARVIDRRALRSVLADRALQEAERLLDKLHEPYEVYAFGGRDNVFSSQKLDEPPAKESREIVASFGVLIQRANDLERMDNDSGADGVRSMLSELGNVLGLGASNPE